MLASGESTRQKDTPTEPYKDNWNEEIVDVIFLNH
jgi:hypothetical protein